MIEFCQHCFNPEHEGCRLIYASGQGYFVCDRRCVGLASDAGVVSGNPAPVSTETGGAIESADDIVNRIRVFSGGDVDFHLSRDEAAALLQAEWINAQVEQVRAAAYLNGMKSVELALLSADDEQIGTAFTRSGYTDWPHAFIRELLRVCCPELTEATTPKPKERGDAS